MPFRPRSDWRGTDRIYSVFEAGLRKLTIYIVAIALGWLSIFGERQRYRNETNHIEIWELEASDRSADAKQDETVRFVEGWQLTSDNTDFGGYSALGRLPDGRLLAISDTGNFLRFSIDENGPHKRSIRAQFGSLPGAGARDGDDGGYDFRERDSESLVIDPGSEQAWVGYEQHHGVRRFTLDLTKITGAQFPEAMRDWPENGGAEAIAKLADGRFLILSERAGDEDGLREGLISDRDPTLPNAKFTAFRYRPPAGFNVTDAASLDDGRVLLLGRKLSLTGGFESVLAIGVPDSIESDTIWPMRTIFRFNGIVPADNYEGMFIEKVGAKTFLWVISDDNFTLLQRTLLLKFELNIPSARRRGPSTKNSEKPLAPIGN